jgi:hypothetical protein
MSLANALRKVKEMEKAEPDSAIKRVTTALREALEDIERRLNELERNAPPLPRR